MNNIERIDSRVIIAQFVIIAGTAVAFISALL